MGLSITHTMLNAIRFLNNVSKWALAGDGDVMMMYCSRLVYKIVELGSNCDVGVYKYNEWSWIY